MRNLYKSLVGNERINSLLKWILGKQGMSVERMKLAQDRIHSPTRGQLCCCFESLGFHGGECEDDCLLGYCGI
jgi:hypothetical protein